MTKRNKKIAIIAILLLAVILALWAWRSGNNDEQQVKGEVVTVQRGDISHLVTSTGTVKPRVGAQVKVGARTSGKVDKLLVQIGQKVEAGQLVAVIEHSDLQAKVAQAQAEVNQVTVQLDQARLKLKRQSALRAEELVPQENVDLAQEEVSVLKAKLAASQAALQTTRVNLGYARITAPINGTVASVSTQEGETVAASLSAPTFITIVDLSQLQVDNYVDETDVGLVKVDQPAYFTVDAYPQKRFQGVVEAVHPSAEVINDVVYYPVIIKITSPFIGLLKPEMTANVSIIVKVNKNVLWLPAGAVKRRGTQAVVFLKQGDQVQQRPIKLGLTQNSKVEIAEGLKEGDRVIIPGPSTPNRPMWR